MAVTIGRVTRIRGLAGQVTYSTLVTQESGDVEVIAFQGSVYGGPIVMITEAWPKGTFVHNAERFGEFGPEWVRRFFA